MTLHTVKDWAEDTKCAPTALAAISGRPISEVMEKINADAIDHTFTQFEDVPPEYWLKALERLGFKVRVDRDHVGLTIDELMERVYSPTPILVFAKDDALNENSCFCSAWRSFC